MTFSRFGLFSISFFPEHKRAAFTLIELLVTITLIAVFAGAALPRMFQSLQTFEIQRDVQNLEKVIRYVHHQAVIRGLVYKIDLDANENTYQILEQKTADDFNAYEPARINRKTLHHLRDGNSFQSARTAYFFFPDGTVTAPFSITVKNERGARAEISGKGLGLFKTTWHDE